MLNFLLKDKYEEVGFMALADRQGGHVFNYIYHNECFYFVDLLNYLYANKSMDNSATMIYQADSLQRYADYYRAKSRMDIRLLVAYQSEQVLPMGRHPGQPLMFFPEEAHLKILHESPEQGIVVKKAYQSRYPKPLSK
jgi:hypothetical protein